MVLVMLFTSASSDKGKGGIVGTSAADFTVSNADGVVSLSQFRGKYVLLTLWSSTDIVSRLDNIGHDRDAAKAGNVVPLSVNFDRSRALFDELVAADSLETSAQYYCERQDRSVFEQKWGVKQQYNSYLISPSGTVLAVNPSSQELNRLVK